MKVLKDKKGKYIDITPPDPIEEDCHDLYYVFINGYDLTKKEMRALFANLASNLDNDLEKTRMADIVYQKLLTRRKKFALEELVFITQYSLYLSYIDVKCDEKGEVKSGYECFSIPKLYIRKENIIKKVDYAGSYNNYPPIIEISSTTMDDLIKTPFSFSGPSSLLSYIKVICHEMTHHKQQYEADMKFMTKSAYNNIISDTLDRIYDDYHTNYDFRGVEVEAELEGMAQAVRLARKYIPEKIKDIETISSLKQYL